MFDGLVVEWNLSASDLGVFAAAFPAGCVVGSLASTVRPDVCSARAVLWPLPAHTHTHIQVLLDRYGRRHAVVVGSCGAALAGALTAAAPSFALLVAARSVQAACWALAQAAATTWYAEFLPSRGRGPLLAAVSVGWPVGQRAGSAALSEPRLATRPGRKASGLRCSTDHRTGPHPRKPSSAHRRRPQPSAHSRLSTSRWDVAQSLRRRHS